MIVTFKSRAAGDVIQFGEVAKRLLGIMGKDPEAAQGIITVEVPENEMPCLEMPTGHHVPVMPEGSTGDATTDPVWYSSRCSNAAAGMPVVAASVARSVAPSRRCSGKKVST